MTTSTIPVDKNGRAYAVGQRVRCRSGDTFTVSEIRDRQVRVGPEYCDYFASPELHEILDPPAAERKAVAKDCDGTECFEGDVVECISAPGLCMEVLPDGSGKCVGTRYEYAIPLGATTAGSLVSCWRLLRRASDASPRDTTPSPAPEEHEAPPSLQELYARFRLHVEDNVPVGVDCVLDRVEVNAKSDAGCLVRIRRGERAAESVFPWSLGALQIGRACDFIRDSVASWDALDGKAMREGVAAGRRGA